MSSIFTTFTKDELAHVTFALEVAVMRSCKVDRARMTESEMRRRFAICERLIGLLRGELGWGIQRVLDHLPRYLRCELDGQPWAPDQRKCWMPGDGT